MRGCCVCKPFSKLLSVLLLLWIVTPGMALGLIDPTRPPDWSSSSLPPAVAEKLNFSALFHSQDRMWVIINDQVLKQGDMIEGFEIMNITSHAVIVQSPEGGSYALSLTDTVKTPEVSRS